MATNYGEIAMVAVRVQQARLPVPMPIGYQRQVAERMVEEIESWPGVLHSDDVINIIREVWDGTAADWTDFVRLYAGERRHAA